MTHEPQHPEYDDGYGQSQNRSDQASDRVGNEDHGSAEGADGPPNEIGLVQDDVRALDALIEANYQIDAVPAPLQPRAQHIAALLGLLEVPIDRPSERVATVLARVGLIHRDAVSNTKESVGAVGAVGVVGVVDEPVLSVDDAEALDAWVLAGYQVSKVAGAMRERARAHGALASLVRESGPIFSYDEREDLVARTLAKVEAERNEIVESYSFTPIPLRKRWADVLSVAAVLLIAGSVLWPVMSAVRDQSRRATCDSNMRTVASALGGYSLDQDGMLPMATAGFGGGTWWNVGRGPKHSNSANLYTLPREHYLDLAYLACPGNPNAPTRAISSEANDWDNLKEISYSYRVMTRPEKALWGTPAKLVIVSDRSPVILRAVRQQKIYPFESSPNHRQRGQYVLRADGSAKWLTSPVLPSGDNIWLPKPLEILIDMAAKRAGIEPLKGTEVPADRQDSFVGP